MSRPLSPTEVISVATPGTGGPSCPWCGAPSRRAFLATDRNRGISGQAFTYRRCGSCETLFLADVPADLGRFYPPSYYGLPGADELDQLARSEAHKVRLLTDRVAPGRLVEVGAGFGVFARAARYAGFDVTAIEMDRRSVDYLRGVVGVSAIESSRPDEALASLPASRAVVMWHSIEHLPRPLHALESAAANLQPGGVLAVATPNPRSLQFRLLGARWAHLDAPRHLFLIPPQALDQRAEELGLRRVLSTTSDPSGRHWNRFGWEHAVRRYPSRRSSTRLTRALSLILTQALRPVETVGFNGSAYTSIFIKTAGS